MQQFIDDCIERKRLLTDKWRDVQRAINDVEKQHELMKEAVARRQVDSTVRLARTAPISSLFALCEVSWEKDPYCDYRYKNLRFTEMVDVSVTPEITRPVPVMDTPPPQRTYLLGPPTNPPQQQHGVGCVVAYKVDQQVLNETVTPDREVESHHGDVTRYKWMRIPIVFVE